jgi:hypothetical protein
MVVEEMNDTPLVADDDDDDDDDGFDDDDDDDDVFPDTLVMEQSAARASKSINWYFMMDIIEDGVV